MSAPHLTPDEFREQGHRVVDWIADYQGRVESLPVFSPAKPGDLRAALPPAAPEQGEAFDAILADVDRLIVPGITHWQSPSFFAYFPTGASGPSILGDLLSSGFGVQGMLWATSPACTWRDRSSRWSSPARTSPACCARPTRPRSSGCSRRAGATCGW